MQVFCNNSIKPAIQSGKLDLAAPCFAVNNFCHLAHDESKTLALEIGFNVIRYKLNLLSFGAAIDRVDYYWIFVNPYVNCNSIPTPVRLQYCPNVGSKIKHLKEPTDSKEYIQDASVLNSSDLWLWGNLPNGWNTTKDFSFLPNHSAYYPYYRPHCTWPIRGDYLDDHVVLHPSKDRPLTDMEFNCCNHHTLNKWLEEEFAKFELLEQPNYFWEAEVDISKTHLPVEHDTRDWIGVPYTWKFKKDYVNESL